MNINEAFNIFSKSRFSKLQKAIKYAVVNDNIVILSKSNVSNYMACSCWIVKEDRSLIPYNLLWLDKDDIEFKEL